MRYSLAIVGTRFRPPSAALLDVMPLGFSLMLRREPGNVHDVNAVMVLVPDSDAWREFATTHAGVLRDKLAPFGKDAGDITLPWHLGYVPREDAVEVARIADSQHIVEWPGTLSFSATGQPRISFTFTQPRSHAAAQPRSDDHGRM